MSHTDVEEITEAGGRFSLTFSRDHRGYFGFQEYVWFDEEEIEELGYVVPGGWTLGRGSGLYSSLEEARAGALEIPWFKMSSHHP